MYSLVSLVGFLDKRRDRLTKDQVENIMRRAESFSHPDSFHEGTIGMIFEDADLVAEFLTEAPKIANREELAEREAFFAAEFGNSPMGML